MGEKLKIEVAKYESFKCVKNNPRYAESTNCNETECDCNNSFIKSLEKLSKVSRKSNYKILFAQHLSAFKYKNMEIIDACFYCNFSIKRILYLQ